MNKDYAQEREEYASESSLKRLMVEVVVKE